MAQRVCGGSFPDRDLRSSARGYCRHRHFGYGGGRRGHRTGNFSGHRRFVHRSARPRRALSHAGAHDVVDSAVVLACGVHRNAGQRQPRLAPRSGCVGRPGQWLRRRPWPARRAHRVGVTGGFRHLQRNARAQHRRRRQGCRGDGPWRFAGHRNGGVRLAPQTFRRHARIGGGGLSDPGIGVAARGGGVGDLPCGGGRGGACSRPRGEVSSQW